MWRETKQLGLGIAKQGRKYIVVGRYRPAGNMTNAGYFERNVAPLNGSGSSLPDLGSKFYLRISKILPVDLIVYSHGTLVFDSATIDRPSRDVSAGDSGNRWTGGCNLDMGGFTGNMDMSSFSNMDMGFSGGSRSVSVSTTTINGRTVETTTVVENGVTTVTTREF